MKYRWDNRYLHWGVTAFLVIAASMLFYYGIFHMKSLLTGIRVLGNILAPIIYGAAIAYILSPVVDFLESYVIYPLLRKTNRNPQKKGKRAVRWICVLFSLVFLLVIIYTLVMMILPELLRSIANLINSLPSYLKMGEQWLQSITVRGGNLDEQTIDLINQSTAELQEYLTNSILPQIQLMLKNISAGVFDVVNFVKDFLIGAVVSLYVLADKERFVAKSKMIVYAALPQKLGNSIIHAMRFTHHTFGGFISGKLLDSAIIGVLCYIGTNLLDMPYALLVSVIVGVTNVIPFFGPYLGAVPCALLILLVDPLKCLYFVIFILILQQFDGNILGPKILGDSTGLSSFMVIVAILVGGGLFGIAGMLVGVPVCAVIYAAIWNAIQKSLQKKEMPRQEGDYLNIDCVELESKRILPLTEKQQRHPAKERLEQREKGILSVIFMMVLTKLMLLLKKGWKAVCAYGSKAYRKVHSYITKNKSENDKKF